MASRSTPTNYRPALDRATTKQALYRAIVDTPFDDPVLAAQLFLGIVVLLMANKKTGMIDRVALSNTHPAKGTVKMSVKRFEDIKIPLDYPDNIIAETIRTGEPHSTIDWRYLFEPALSAQEARLNQAGGGIAYSMIYPITAKTKKGALIFSFFQYPEHITDQQHAFMRSYSQTVTDRLNSVR